METDDTPAEGPTVLDPAAAEPSLEAVEPVVAPPPVVAVVVTKNPQECFEATLAALGAQDYPDLTVLVIDAGSDDDPTARVAAVSPRAFVRRTGAVGFAAAANVAIEAVEGATFLLCCHDDVELDPSCVRLLVEEAFRSNAAILGPKLVRADNPEILTTVGLAIDRFGVPFSGIEPGELDQEQHDGVRDVFYVPSATMLVRTDLFRELGGFDAEAFPGAEDLDLCWRTRLIGGRVLVVPDARAAHREATGDRPRSERSSTAEVDRNRVRTVLKSYSFPTLLWTIPLGLLIAVLESIGLAVSGRGGRARSILGAWTNNLAHPARFRAARRPVQRSRTVPDRELRYLQIRGSTRVAAFFARRLHTDDRLRTLSVAGRDFMGSTARRARRPIAVGGFVLAFAYLVGSRSFITGRVPEIGAFLHWPGAGRLGATFASAWRYSGLGHALPAAPAFALLSVLNVVTLGRSSLAQTIFVLAAVPIGALGVYRCARPLSPSVVPASAAAFAYAVNPVARNMLAAGRLGPLVFFALLPYLTRVLWHAVGSELGLGDVDKRRPTVRSVLALGALMAVATAAFPSAGLFVVGMTLAMLVGVPLIGHVRFAVRSVVVVVLAAAVALILLLPWPLSWLGGGDRNTIGWAFRSHWGLADVLRFHTGPAGSGWAGLALLATASLSLLVGSGTRFTWAVRAWLMALAGFAFVWVPARWWPHAAMPAPEGALTVAAFGLAVAVGIGIGVFVDDLRRVRFGWRQLAAVIAVGVMIIPTFGFLADVGTGRWGAPAHDWAASLSFMAPQARQGAFRVLWVGDPSILPGDPSIRPTGIGFSVSRNGPGDARDLWPTPTRGADRLVAESIDLVASARTNRLGHLLGPMGVRYIAVPDTRGVGDSHTVDVPGLRAALSDQLDLTQLDVHDNGLLLYENQSWTAVASTATGDAASTLPVNSSDPKRDALLAELTSFAPVPLPGTTAKPVSAGVVMWAESFNSGWKASAGGARLAHERSFGWSNAYRVASPARITLAFEPQTTRTIVVAIDAVMWLGVALVLLATRRRRDRSRSARRSQQHSRVDMVLEKPS